MNLLRKPKLNSKIIGITGTAGKTVLSHMITHVLRINGYKTALLSTSECSINGKSFATKFNANLLTKKEFNAFLNACTKENVEFIVLEITSKNIQKNLYINLDFDAICLSNIFHNDSFENWDEYAKTKLSVIKKIKDEGILTLNADDVEIADWLAKHESEVTQSIYTLWASKSQIKDVRISMNGISFIFNNVLIQVQITGEYNLTNVLVAIETLQKYVNLEKIANALKTFKAPEGRLHFTQKSPYFIVVDNAKNIASLQQSLAFLNKIKQQGQRIISIIGSNNLHNPNNKLIGDTAKLHSDIVVLTSQDPNNQSVYDINSSILPSENISDYFLIERFNSNEEYKIANKSGLSKRINSILSDNRTPFVAFDEDHFMSRLDAIRFAISEANFNDIIYINGKGDERTTVYNFIEYEWSDYEALNIAQSSENYDFDE